MATVPVRAKCIRSIPDDSIPPLLRPLLRAYALGYASTVAPRVLTLLLQLLSRRRSKRAADQDQVTFHQSLRQVLFLGLDPQRFPTFCAVLVGGSTLLEVPLGLASETLISGRLSELSKKRLSRWLATFAAAWLGARLLQSKQSSSFVEEVPVWSDTPPRVKTTTIRYAGRTLDLTLFAAVRALDVVVGELWARRKARSIKAGKWTQTEEVVSRLTDSVMFAASCALIMWTWIYHPCRLPVSYNKWIDSAAAVDRRLIQALQRCRTGELRYGEETGQAGLLGGMCADYKWPLEWGNPAKAIPFPCEVVHMGCGANCEYHAFVRFGRSFYWSLATYLPLNLILVARKPNGQNLIKAILSAARSSAFLGSFIMLFYYGVCLMRSRLGPHIIGKDTQSRQRIDGGWCVGCGCVLCGWSVLIENASRRKDMALFVMPRALGTLLPRRYPLEKQWRETFTFAFSTAIVFTCVLENKSRVRGVLGKVLGSVLNA